MWTKGTTIALRIATLGQRAAISIVCALCLTCGTASTVSADTRHSSWVPSDEFLAELSGLIEKAAVPGISIAVIEAGEMVWHRHFGVANEETQAPVNDESIFEAASMSKPVFTYLVLQLADAGLLDLDRPLVEYHKPHYVSDHPFVDRITAKDVLRHTTGLTNWRQPEVAALTPSFKPGTAFSYSGTGFIWLQQVVRRLTGMSLDALAQHKLFGPAGMKNSSFIWSDERQRHQVWGHQGGDDSAGKIGFQFRREFFGPMLEIAKRSNGKTGLEKPISQWDRDDELAAHLVMRTMPGLHPSIAGAELRNFRSEMNLLHNAAGGLGTTAKDYARFMILMMEDRERAAWELSNAARKSMIARQSLLDTGVTDQAFGWRAEDTSQGRVIFHGGNNGDIFKCFSALDPAQGRGIVILTNGGNGDKLYKHVVERVTGLQIKDLAEIEDLLAERGEADPREVGSASVFPTRDWEHWPNAKCAGIDPVALEIARRHVVDKLNTTGLHVSIGGRVLMEHGDTAELSYIASCRKSVLGMLYGRYVESGLIDLDASLGELGIGDVQGLLEIEKSATVRNLLESRSGVFHPASNPGSDLASAPTRGSVVPGSQFLYSNWDFNTAGKVFEQCVGRSIYDALEQDIAIPIGMQDFDRSVQSKSGNIDASRHPAYHMVLSTRDMARLGLLMLHRGGWEGKQVVPEFWVEEMLKPITRSDATGPKNTPLGYGLMWWIWDGEANFGAFKGAFTARGHFGQYITVLPALDMVVAHKTKLVYGRPTSGGDYYELLNLLAVAARPEN